MLAGPIPDGLKLTQASLPALPAPQDTAETEDIQLTPAGKAQALALNNNPVQIYNWVHNNIAFIPRSIAPCHHSGKGGGLSSAIDRVTAFWKRK
ncbi:MAG: hypothetical protein Q7T25_13755 [Sideroxyarcus sp.]|nr:hypothetical protein [Sideroxyarcus sp.]